MSRNPEKNAQVRKGRKKQILDATLSVYIRSGYHGTDMDIVAKEAGLAKGLVYYYYKTKQELFTELFMQMFKDGFIFSETLINNLDGLNPVEQLMAYAYGMFMENRENPRMMQFFIRAPFDAYAIFTAENRKEVADKSDMHRSALTGIIQKGIAEGFIPETNPSMAANSFWSVFVANVFVYSRLIDGTHESAKSSKESFKEVVCFCFQGLGIERDVWNACLDKVLADTKAGG